MKVTNKINIIKGMVSIGVISIVSLIFAIYLNHKNIIIQQQEDQLITIAKTASNNLTSFFEDSEKSLDNFFNMDYFKGLHSEAISDEINLRIKGYVALEGDYIEELSYYTLEEIKTGTLKKSMPIDEKVLETYIDNAFNESGALLGPWVLTKDCHYSLYLFKSIKVKESLQGLLIEKINLNEVYNMTLGKVKVGEYGYCTLKDNNGIILMHGNKNQVGIDSLKERKALYPELDPKGIERLVANQLKGEPGSDIIKSYWWGEDEVKQVKKIIAYNPVNIGSYTWVVNAIMSYDEITNPINKTFYLLFLLTVILLCILGYTVFFMTSMRKEKEKILIELKYKEELNEAAKELRRHEDKLNHFNRVETIGMFASSIAHDLNNLLTPIFIYCDMVLDSLKDNLRAQQDLMEIKAGLNNCVSLTKNLLDYSKFRNNTNEHEVFNGSLVLEDCITMIKTMVPSSIKIDTLVALEPLMLYGRKLEFKQIILNLCTNAYQAMEDKGGTLTISFLPQGDFAELKIQDTGCGIDPQVKDQIFQPFFTSKSLEKGTGLGLSIVMRLVKNFKGSLDFNSETNIGSTFIIKFPLKAN